MNQNSTSLQGQLRINISKSWLSVKMNGRSNQALHNPKNIICIRIFCHERGSLQFLLQMRQAKLFLVKLRHCKYYSDSVCQSVLQQIYQSSFQLLYSSKLASITFPVSCNPIYWGANVQRRLEDEDSADCEILDILDFSYSAQQLSFDQALFKQHTD